MNGCVSHRHCCVAGEGHEGEGGQEASHVEGNQPTLTPAGHQSLCLTNSPLGRGSEAEQEGSGEAKSVAES